MPRNKELEIAYQILGGIPEKQVHLNCIVKKPGRTVRGRPFCGTVACGVGWLLMHPRYKRRGFGVRLVDDRELEMKSPSNPQWSRGLGFYRVAEEMFGIPAQDASRIFGLTTRDDKPHKAILLERIRDYLRS